MSVQVYTTIGPSPHTVSPPDIVATLKIFLCDNIPATCAPNIPEHPYKYLTHRIDAIQHILASYRATGQSPVQFYLQLYIDSHIPLFTHPAWGPDITRDQITQLALHPESHHPISQLTLTHNTSLPEQHPIRRCIYKTIASIIVRTTMKHALCSIARHPDAIAFVSDCIKVHPPPPSHHAGVRSWQLLSRRVRHHIFRSHHTQRPRKCNLAGSHRRHLRYMRRTSSRGIHRGCNHRHSKHTHTCSSSPVACVQNVRRCPRKPQSQIKGPGPNTPSRITTRHRNNTTHDTATAVVHPHSRSNGPSLSRRMHTLPPHLRPSPPNTKRIQHTPCHRQPVPGKNNPHHMHRLQKSMCHHQSSWHHALSQLSHRHRCLSGL